MADPFKAWFSMFDQTIGKFLYDPTTNWDLFNSNLVFNFNPQDKAVESHVLSRVGSYGSQIDKLIDAIEVLRVNTDLTGADAAQQASLAAFDALRKEAADAVAEFRANLSAADLLAGAKALHQRNPPAAEALAAQIVDALNGRAQATTPDLGPVAAPSTKALLSSDYLKS